MKRARSRSIVIARRYGQLGNCLYLYAHAIATACELNAEVSNPSFGKYAKYFRSTANDPLCRFPAEPFPARPSGEPSERTRRWLYQATYLPTRALAHVGLTRWPRQIIRLHGDEQCDLDSPEFAERLMRSGRVYLQGWLFRANSIFAKHLSAIRTHFQPIPEHQEAVERTLSQARQDCDLLVGVHIRQGDYAEFQGGRYFYSLDQYRQLMMNVQQQVGRGARFLVCSDAQLQADDFPGLSVTLGPGHLIEDMYSLAGCDLLMGPPSTFSGWASIYGDVPLYRINDPEAPIDVAQLRHRQTA